MVGKICRLGGQQLPGTLAVKSAITVWFISSIWMDRPNETHGWKLFWRRPESGEESERVTETRDGRRRPRRTKRGNWLDKDIA
jgi:hypothetical protein